MQAGEFGVLCHLMDAAFAALGDSAITPYVELMRDHGEEIWAEWGCWAKGSSRGLETANFWRKVFLTKTNHACQKTKGSGKYLQALRLAVYTNLPLLAGCQQQPWSVRSKEAARSPQGVVHPRCTRVAFSPGQPATETSPATDPVGKWRFARPARPSPYDVMPEGQEPFV